MQIDEQIIHCVGFLGQPTEVGFLAEGTCFFLGIMEDELAFCYAVTARHIVKPFDVRTHQANHNPIWIRLQRKSAPPRLVETKRSEWICHVDRFIQICVHSFDMRKWDSDDDLDLQTLSIPQIIMTKEIEEHFGFGLGSDVFIPSVLINRVGEKQNIPIARIGSIASMPKEAVPGGSPRRPAYLIETRSMGGSVGAPVLFHTDAYRRYRRHGFEDEWINAVLRDRAAVRNFSQRVERTRPPMELRYLRDVADDKGLDWEYTERVLSSRDLDEWMRQGW